MHPALGEEELALNLILYINDSAHLARSLEMMARSLDETPSASLSLNT